MYIDGHNYYILYSLGLFVCIEKCKFFYIMYFLYNIRFVFFFIILLTKFHNLLSKFSVGTRTACYKAHLTGCAL